MRDLDPKEIFETLASNWAGALGEKRHHEAILTALLGYFVFREKKHERFERETLTWIHTTIENLQTKENLQTEGRDVVQPSCSFCGRGEPEVRLAAGPEVFICDSCVATLSDVFGRESGK